MSAPGRYVHELRALHQALLRMGGLVEQMLGDVIEALGAMDPELANRVLEMDRTINQLELDIDELCLRIIALHRPAAGDLRFVTASMKLVTDLERMGDLVANVAERVLALTHEERLKPFVPLSQMAQEVQAMIALALDAFVAQDEAQARQVIEADEGVDELHWRIRREVIARMTQDGAVVSQGVNLLLLSKHLERLGDHATNIAEGVIFMVCGHDVRHGQ